MSNTAVGILGILTPSLTLDAVVAVFFHKCKDSTVLGRLLIGIRPVCLGMVIGVLLSIAKTTFSRRQVLHWVPLPSAQRTGF